MKKILLMLGLVATFILPASVNAETKADNSLYAVAFHADWCGSCQVIGSNVAKARGKADLDNKDVLFVKLDLTNAATRHQSSLMASALGLGEFYKTNAGKTGFVLLVNAKNGEVVGKLTKEHDANAIIAAINEKTAAL